MIWCQGHKFTQICFKAMVNLKCWDAILYWDVSVQAMLALTKEKSYANVITLLLI